MFDSAAEISRLVFLHIPKTAGQTVHNELARAVGVDNVSPVRVHTQVRTPAAQFPSGYRLYSGHLDWIDLGRVPSPRFVFSILRDPRERIASFYFYLRKQALLLPAAELGKPHHHGKKQALLASADDYFFGGGENWQCFIRDHYDNFYCRYFASRLIRAGTAFGAWPDQKKIKVALNNLSKIDWVYSVEHLELLEADIRTLFGLAVNLRNTFDNKGDRPTSEPRWPRLLNACESDTSRRKLEDFVELDLRLMKHLEW